MKHTLVQIEFGFHFCPFFIRHDKFCNQPEETEYGGPLSGQIICLIVQRHWYIESPAFIWQRPKLNKEGFVCILIRYLLSVARDWSVNCNISSSVYFVSNLRDTDFILKPTGVGKKGFYLLSKINSYPH